MKTRVITSALIKNEKRYLISRRAKTQKFAPNRWELVSGFIEGSETAEDTIIRELNEETNLSGRVTKSGYPYIVEDNDGKWIIIPFIIETKSNKFKISKEHSAMKWVTKEDLVKYRDIKADLKEFRKQKLI